MHKADACGRPDEGPPGTKATNPNAAQDLNEVMGGRGRGRGRGRRPTRDSQFPLKQNHKQLVKYKKWAAINESIH